MLSLHCHVSLDTLYLKFFGCAQHSERSAAVLVKTSDSNKGNTQIDSSITIDGNEEFVQPHSYVTNVHLDFVSDKIINKNDNFRIYLKVLFRKKYDIMF